MRLALLERELARVCARLEKICAWTSNGSPTCTLSGTRRSRTATSPGTGRLVGDGEELHAEVAGAVRLGEEVAVGLHAVGEEDRAAQVARREEAVRELQRACDVGRGAEPRPVAFDRR